MPLSVHVMANFCMASPAPTKHCFSSPVLKPVLDFQEGNIHQQESDDTLLERIRGLIGQQGSLLLGSGHHLQRRGMGI